MQTEDALSLPCLCPGCGELWEGSTVDGNHLAPAAYGELGHGTGTQGRLLGQAKAQGNYTQRAGPCSLGTFPDGFLSTTGQCLGESLWAVCLSAWNTEEEKSLLSSWYRR